MICVVLVRCSQLSHMAGWEQYNNTHQSPVTSQMNDRKNLSHHLGPDTCTHYSRRLQSDINFILGHSDRFQSYLVQNSIYTENAYFHHLSFNWFLQLQYFLLNTQFDTLLQFYNQDRMSGGAKMKLGKADHLGRYKIALLDCNPWFKVANRQF